MVNLNIMVLEVGLTALPGGGRAGTEAMTVTGWFELFGEHPFMGLRNLGLMNILAVLLSLPTYLALYVIHREFLLWRSRQWRYFLGADHGHRLQPQCEPVVKG